MAKQQAMRQEIGDASNRPRETFQPEQERMSLPRRAGYRFEEACCDMGVLRRERRQDRVGVIDHDSAAPGNGDTVQDVPGSLEIIGIDPGLDLADLGRDSLQRSRHARSGGSDDAQAPN